MYIVYAHVHVEGENGLLVSAFTTACSISFLMVVKAFQTAYQYFKSCFLQVPYQWQATSEREWVTTPVNLFSCLIQVLECPGGQITGYTLQLCTH